jgi:methionine-S-sulfoxide reductase
LNRQGPDIGTQYRSAIFFTTVQQEAAAKKALQSLLQEGRQIVTTILPATHFYQAEDYHQQYAAKNGLHCNLTFPHH